MGTRMVRISEYIIEKLHINKDSKIAFGNLEYNKPTLEIHIYEYTDTHELTFYVKYGNIDDLKVNKNGSYKLSFYSAKDKMPYKYDSIFKNENNICEKYINNELVHNITFYLQGNGAKKFLEEFLNYNDENWINFKFFNNIENFKNIIKNHSSMESQAKKDDIEKWLNNF